MQLLAMFLSKSKGNDLRRNICQNRPSEGLDINKRCGGFINTGKEKYYDAWKEALNAATNEVKKCKRNFEHKL